MPNIYSSDSLQILLDQLAGDIRKSDSGIFAKHVIITQTAGMNAWLRTGLTRKNGVFVNFEFQNQDGFLSSLYQLMFGERPRNNHDTIKYKVYESLNSEAFRTEFPVVGKYYEENDLRRIQLAARIADLFDQYQLYRPEMIIDWEKGRLSTGNQDEKWQQWLWNGIKTGSRAAVRQKIFDHLEENRDLIRKTFPEVALFGISVYTLFHLEFYRKLAEYTSVHFYVTLPGKDADPGNELLAAFGLKSRELAGMFPDAVHIPRERTGDTLLTRIRNQIVNNGICNGLKADDSVQVNSCYTPAREAECVYNYLLDLFEKDRKDAARAESEGREFDTLKPGDILVMVTDIDKYAPYIRAVFRNAPVNIPFRISGSPGTSDDTITAALELILDFREEDLTSEKVIALLEQKRIRERFNIGDCSYIRSVVNRANIRFGRRNRAEDDTVYVSWEYGLEKIILGYAMLTDEQYTGNNGLSLFPFRDTEASKSYDLFRLKAFMDSLVRIIEARDERKTINDWKKFLFEEVIDRMIRRNDLDKEDRSELSSIHKALSFQGRFDFDQEVPFPVFLHELKVKLFTTPTELRIMTGNVTVSSPIPVRGLPFRVICFLGLNSDAFPRKDRYAGFDLLGEEYRLGDRSKKETDKLLFLDTILAAGEKLYMSYTGQSVKDNTEVPPSIALDTFLHCTGLTHIVVKHPLHGFSSRYQASDKRLFTYLYSSAPAIFSPAATSTEYLTEVPVHSLVKFFEHPAEWYFRNILGIHYTSDEGTLPETELFGLDGLESWQVKSSLIKYDGDIESFRSKGIREGFLPLKNLGRLTVEHLAEEISTVRSVYKRLTENREERTVSIDLIITGVLPEGESVVITGNIDGIFGRQYIHCSFISDTMKDSLRAFIKTIVLCAVNEIDSSVLISRDGELINIPVPTKSDAVSRIRDLLKVFIKGQSSPLKFSLGSFKAVGDESKARNIFLKEAKGDYNRDPDPYLSILFDEHHFAEFDIDPFDPDAFDPDIYLDPVYDEIKMIGQLLNLETN